MKCQRTVLVKKQTLPEGHGLFFGNPHLLGTGGMNVIRDACEFRLHQAFLLHGSEGHLFDEAILQISLRPQPGLVSQDPLLEARPSSHGKTGVLAVPP